MIKKKTHPLLTCGSGGCDDVTHSSLLGIARLFNATDADANDETAFAALTTTLRAWAVSTASTPVLLHLHSKSISVLAAATIVAVKNNTEIRGVIRKFF